MAIKILDLTGYEKDKAKEIEWKSLRKLGITSSEAATICGVNPYECEIELYHRKKGTLQEIQENENMKHGKGLEDYVFSCFLEQFRIDNPGAIISGSNPYGLYQHETQKHHLSTPDRVITIGFNGKMGLVELKTASEYMSDAWEDSPPEHYIIQVHHQMYVMDMDFAYIAVLIGGNKFKYFRIERDEAIINSMLEMLNRFWFEYYMKDIVPPLDASPASTEYIKNLHPESKADTHIEIPQCASDLLIFLHWRAVEDEAKTNKDFYATKIKEVLGDHEKGFLPDGTTISWKSFKKAAYMVKEQTQRPFKVTLPKVKKLM